MDSINILRAQLALQSSSSHLVASLSDESMALGGMSSVRPGSVLIQESRANDEALLQRLKRHHEALRVVPTELSAPARLSAALARPLPGNPLFGWHFHTALRLSFTHTSPHTPTSYPPHAHTQTTTTTTTTHTKFCT